MSVQYGQWWVRDLEEPAEVSAGFDLDSEDEPSIEHTAPIQSYTPWVDASLGEEAVPIHVIGQERGESGSLRIRFMRGGAAPDEGVETGLRAVRDLIRHRRPVVILRPGGSVPDRIFATLTDISETRSDLPYEAVYDLSYEQTLWIEDVYDRERFERGASISNM